MMKNLLGLLAACGLGVALMVLSGCASKPPGHSLAETINDYREARGLTAIPWSPALAEVAEVHLADVEAHDPAARQCSLHSWSDDGPWTPRETLINVHPRVGTPGFPRQGASRSG